MNNIINQELTETIKVKNIYSYENIIIKQPIYPLTELELELILNGKSQTSNWAHTIFLTSIGYSLGLLKKFFDVNETISISEWGALGTGIGFSFLIYIIGWFLPSKRKKIINNIQQCFDKSPQKQYFMEQNNDNS